VTQATIQDSDGNELARVEIGSDNAAPRTLTFRRVHHGKGRLLHYYFGRGGRAVAVTAGEFTLRGTLATSWLGQERLWLVRLSPSMARSTVARSRL